MTPEGRVRRLRWIRANLESLGRRRELEDRDVQGGGLSLRGGEFITRGGELRFDGVALRDSLGEGGADGVRVRNFESGT